MGGLIYYLINFSLFVGLMVFLYRRFGEELLATRSEQFKQALEYSAQELVKADAELKAARALIESLPAEKEALFDSVVGEGEAIARRIRVKGREAVKAIEEETARRVEREYERAVKEMRQELIEMSVRRAWGKLSRGVSPEIERRLRDEALSGLGGSLRPGLDG